MVNLGLVQWRMSILRYISLGMSVLLGTTARLAVHDQNPALQVQLELKFHLKMKILTSLTHTYVIENLYDFLYSVGQKGDV